MERWPGGSVGCGKIHSEEHAEGPNVGCEKGGEDESRLLG